ncbi:nucleoside 2-deoxyribosyltransferase [Breznakiella homolactica]|uniref:Nucleoside 2-deoxyribosyltransferase n=1 Tax=Breznakiella homolactica TaxID=2798577 RepID=A0A7T8B9Z7_9SPIR|nr:nucleoside 2-deoxyribosyltransferase [Breznakiella homolactica]QQO08450.1 nucleoside 2-deoxyribosyltransferase [Breznakiella homolactica]
MNRYGELGLYIAGPECFYPRGYSLWNAQKKLAEYYGFNVVLPNDTPKKLDHENLRLNADAIFANLKEVIKETGIIIADLELFRSTEADGGTVFEMGMAHAKGALLYGYTRDKRAMVQKNQFCAMAENGGVRAQDGQIHRYADLPFAPSIVASAMIVEGDFHDCLRAVMSDLDERKKREYLGGAAACSAGATIPERPGDSEPVIFLSGPGRYSDNARERYAEMVRRCRQSGFKAVTPLDGLDEIELQTPDPLERACRQFSLWQRHVRNCDIFLGDIGDFHGWEPCSDTAFEAGAAWMLRRECYCYMPDTSPMMERIPNIGGLDWAGNIVENFNYPVNLMFASSMPVLQGSFEDVLEQIVKLRSK